ncbi:DNA helicase [Sphingobium sp. TA15]|uniref:DNA 3'-5' helicase n=1 Tax=Sphingobium indicum (strain DSM 16413 / CCM 7287 / MTCC 6362 / UT26 / NBRC 101211 / UT26S) TaxID=452662 RepID=D4Z2N8_SPHIU|nr:UvrD-helicase domain-containing protein [Sphingobium indicum]BAI96870.1 putative ATP-dependent DNA helicase [Sphingobium indicum UT26S]BDD66305.1 DNA helicase [Sphingobium sp. TA15]
MDAVELARQIAADLHRQAVVKGHDPWQPYEFAIAEAQRRGLDVEPTAAGSVMLDGGRATVVAADCLILHENIGTVFERAFLVAHEIGHIELGDDVADEPARDIDLARAAEPSPVGVDRVVDYGRRQRREVQMDLFAREFLLPRGLVRKLHLEDGQTATEIAARIGAPFDLVAQQLFDALLLPEIVAAAETETIERPLNPLQASAAAHRGEAFLLEAGPGTGKTQTLTARVEGLLAEGVDPRRILLLTFSNKAAGEMAERIGRKHKVAAAAMWIGTFHAFGLDIIRRFHIELGLPKDPRMMDRTEAVELLEAEFPRLGLNHYRNLYDPTQIIADMLAAISRAKDEVVNEVRYAELAEAMFVSAVTPEDREAAERAEEVARVYAAYEGLKRQAHCVDFGDLVSMPVRLLEGNLEIRAHLQAQYDHVLVDEYQDVNRSSVRLITALRSDGRNLWVVGDAKQSIYRFRGASSFNMTRFGTSDFPGGARGRLKRNYRSADEVVQAFSAFAIRMKAGDQDSGLESERGRCGASPQLRTVDQSPQQTVALADAIEEMRQAGHTYRDQAVLCTGNEKLSELGQDLERLGVPVLFLGSLFERPEIKELLSLLTILTDRRAMGLVRAACMSEFAMPLSDVDALFDHLRAVDSIPGAWLGELGGITGLSETGSVALGAVAAAMRGFDQSASPWTVLATLLLDRTRITARIGGSNDIAERTRGLAIWQFMNFLRVQPGGQGLPIVRLLDRVRRLVRLGDDRDLRQLPAAAQGLDAVRLMTIHGAKGLEFPVVHVPGLNGDTIPRTPQAPPCPPPDGMVEGAEGRALDVFRAGHAEEQECLFYVALSRARDRLFLYAPTQKSNGHNRPLSSFLDRVGSGLARTKVNPAKTLPPAPEAGDVTLVVDGALRFTGAQIALYERCPRRFFYTHVLQVGGRRTATAFMQMHEAVRTVFQTVIADARIIGGEGDLERQIANAFAAHGLADHGYVSEYKGFATSMIQYFLAAREGHTPEAPAALSIAFGTEEIIVRPDEVLVQSDGSRTLRRVQTGHFRAAEMDDVGVAAFLLAAQRAFPGASVELVHLSDQTIRAVDLTAKKLQNRQEKLSGFLGRIRAGNFPAAPSGRTCPGCPAFFICGPTPAGTLRKNFG